jgi:mitochondrial fission protein ELM1
MATPPKVWVLLGTKAGGNGQLISLADALGWPYETKQLVYNWLNRCPNILLGPSLISLDRRKSSPLLPPWPDLVIAASRRSTPVALWIKKQSGGQTRLVHLMHAQAPLDLFDLIITTPQYCLPLRANILHNIAPLNRIAPDRLATTAMQWKSRLSAFPRPYVALLVGGNSATYEFDTTTAADLGHKVSAKVRQFGGSLLVSSSPRTPAASAEALFTAIDCPAYRYRWRPNDPDNPYLAYLALADSFIVTVDSASQVVEACLMNKPVQIFEWPPRPTPRFPIKGALQRWTARHRERPNEASLSKPRDILVQFYDHLVYVGLIKPTRDFGAYFQALKAQGLVTRFEDRVDPTQRQALNDMERAVTRIRQLFATS